MVQTFIWGGGVKLLQRHGVWSNDAIKNLMKRTNLYARKCFFSHAEAFSKTKTYFEMDLTTGEIKPVIRFGIQ